MGRSPLLEVQRTFRAMNTEILTVVGATSYEQAAAEVALATVEALFREVEETLSRFRPDSELSALNRSCGEPFQASPLLLQVVDAALHAARATGGAFDPTMLRALRRAGYDRSFELLEDVGLLEPALDVAGDAWPARWSWKDVKVHGGEGTISVPPGCELDLGGIGKGWTVDVAAGLLRGFTSFAIDAGGDMVLSGAQPSGEPWTIGVENPRAPDEDLLVLAIRDRAVATSTTTRRRWTHNGRVQHHLIDPRTGRPSRSGVLSVTVVADTAAQAETLAKAALIAGPLAGLNLIDEQPRAAGLLVLADGQMETSSRFRELCNAF